MKKAICILFIIFIAKTVAGQISVNKTGDNYIWAGIPYVVEVTGIKNPTDIQLQIEDGKISKLNENSFNIEVKSIGMKSLLIYNHETLTDSVIFHVKLIHTPYASLFINNKAVSGGKVSKLDLLLVQQIDAVTGGINFDVHFDIKSYKLGFYNDCRYKEFHFTSEHFNETHKHIFSQLRKGDLIFFRDIIARGPSGKNRKLNDMIFEID